MIATPDHPQLPPAAPDDVLPDDAPANGPAAIPADDDDAMWDGVM